MDLAVRPERYITQMRVDCGEATRLGVAPRLLARFHALDEVFGVLIKPALAGSYTVLRHWVHLVKRFSGLGSSFRKDLPPAAVNH